MKLSLAITTTALALSISTLQAQQGGFGGPRGGDQGGGGFGGPRGGQGGQFGGQGGGQFGGRGGRGGPPPHPVATAIDVNNDFTIDAAEIKAAASNLLKNLDRNNDGQLTSDETEPGPPGGQFGGPSGRGGQQFGGPRGGQSGQGGQEFGGPRGGSQGRGGFGGPRGGDQGFSGPQGRGQGQGGPQGRGSFGGPGGRQGGPPPHPLGTAIDTNNDGTMSKTELAKASTSLLKLDENGDGRISMYEARPKHGPGGPGGGRSGFGGRGGDNQFGGPRGGQGQFGGPSGGQGQFGGPQGGPGFGGQMPRGGQGQGGPGGSFGGRPNQGQTSPVDRLMSLDTNGDGKVSRSEIPNTLRSLSQADRNKDGYITRAEATVYVNTFMNNRNNRRGPQGGNSGTGQRRPSFDQ